MATSLGLPYTDNSYLNSMLNFRDSVDKKFRETDKFLEKIR